MNTGEQQQKNNESKPRGERQEKEELWETGTAAAVSHPDMS